DWSRTSSVLVTKEAPHRRGLDGDRRASPALLARGTTRSCTDRDRTCDSPVNSRVPCHLATVQCERRPRPRFGRGRRTPAGEEAPTRMCRLVVSWSCRDFKEQRRMSPWIREQESNLHPRVQSPPSCRWTTPEWSLLL